MTEDRSQMTPLRPVGFGGQAEDRRQIKDFGFWIADLGLMKNSRVSDRGLQSLKSCRNIGKNQRCK